MKTARRSFRAGWGSGGAGGHREQPLSRGPLCPPGNTEPSRDRSPHGHPQGSQGLPRWTLQVIQSHAPEYQPMGAGTREEETRTHGHRRGHTWQPCQEPADSVHQNQRTRSRACAEGVVCTHTHTHTHTSARPCPLHIHPGTQTREHTLHTQNYMSHTQIHLETDGML